MISDDNLFDFFIKKNKDRGNEAMSISKDKIIQEQSLLEKLEKQTTSIAHIGHVEIGVTNLEKSLWFFTEVMGLFFSNRRRQCLFKSLARF